MVSVLSGAIHRVGIGHIEAKVGHVGEVEIAEYRGGFVEGSRLRTDAGTQAVRRLEGGGRLYRRHRTEGRPTRTPFAFQNGRKAPRLQIHTKIPSPKLAARPVLFHLKCETSNFIEGLQASKMSEAVRQCSDAQ